MYSYKQKCPFLVAFLVNITLHINYYKGGITPKLKNYFQFVIKTELVTVAERSKACTVFARSEAAIVGSNPMDV
jgi:hypothetical protein